MQFNLFDLFFANKRSVISQFLLLKFFLLLNKINPVTANDHNSTETPSNDQYPNNFKVIIPIYVGSLITLMALTTLAYWIFLRQSAHAGFEEIKDTPSILALPTEQNAETYNTNTL